jgi:uncharacterized membrane protein
MAGQPQEPSWSPHPPAQPGYSPPPAQLPPPQAGQQQYGYPPPGYGEQTQAYSEQAQAYSEQTQVYAQQPQPYGAPGQGYPGDYVTGTVQPPAPARSPGQSQWQGPGQGQSQDQSQGLDQDHARWQLPPPQSFRRPSPARAPRAPGQAKGFVSSLFDFGFTSFVTPKIIKVLYALVTIWTLLWALAFLDIGFRYGHAVGGLLTLVIVDPILILMSLGVIRVVLEFFMISFRMQEDLKALRESGQAGRDEGGASGS